MYETKIYGYRRDVKQPGHFSAVHTSIGGAVAAVLNAVDAGMDFSIITITPMPDATQPVKRTRKPKQTRKPRAAKQEVKQS
jgi:hypothetical protein